MFCPKCSQKQVNDETRYCSQCGFQLNVVKALLIEDNLTQLPNAEAPKIDRSLRKRDLTIGASFMFICALTVAAITVDMPSSHSARIILLIIAWLVLTLVINIKPIIKFFLQADSSVNNTPAIENFSNLFANKKYTALPDSYSIPAENLINSNINTAEIIQPVSITEPTTNLLDKKRS